MKKRIFSLVLALVMCVGLAVPAFAEMDQASIEAVQSEKPLYDRHTIAFNTAETAYCMEDESDTSTIAQTNIEAAKEYVLSLDLGEQGYDYVEESCLAQLEDFSTTDGFILESYTVLTPKNAAATPQYYGTYKGFTFYSADFSETTANGVDKTYEIGSGNKDNIAKFMKGTLDWIITFANWDVASFNYMLLCQILNTPDYVVSTKDLIQEGFKIDPLIARGIYTKSGPNDGYVRYYSSERGTCYPNLVYRPSASGKFTQAYNFAGKTVKTPNYDDKTYQMQQAYDWIFYAGHEKPHRSTLANQEAKYRWG